MNHQELEQQTAHYLLGLDLGQMQDPSALSVIKRFLRVKGGGRVDEYAKYEGVYQALHMTRFPLGTDYTTVADRVKEVALKAPMHGKAILVVDASGVGRGIVDMLYERLRGTTVAPVPITIIGGDKVASDERGGYRVPKRDLVHTVRLLLELDQLQLAEDLPDLPLVKRELQDFRIKLTKSANEIYEAREGAHDDLVLSIALPCWYGENYMSRNPFPPKSQDSPWKGILKD